MLQLYLLGVKKYIIEHYLNNSINGTKKKCITFVIHFFLSGKRDSNPRPPAWKASALSTELFPQLVGWAVMDSNHRRLRQLSYSQPHLATLVTAHALKNSFISFLRVQR